MDGCKSKVKNIRRHLRVLYKLETEEVNVVAPPPQKRGGSEVHKVPKDARTRMGKVIFKHGMASDCIIL